MKKYPQSVSQNPVFSGPLSLPLKIMPSFIHDKALVTVLNRIFYSDINEGELDFFQNRIIHISIEDTGITYRFTLHENKLIPVSNNQSPDLLLKGTMYSYLLLASRREDTDTLFFNRRILMQGDTELGLCVKNFLDGLDMDSHKIFSYLELLLQKSLPVYERLLGTG